VNPIGPDLAFRPRRSGARTILLIGGLAFALGSTSGCATGGSPSADRSGAPALEYRLYVANESSDLVSRVVFDREGGARVEREIPVGVMPADTDGPHGVAVAPDGEHWYVTIAHGTPDGWLWKLVAGADTLVSRTPLGRFPASMGLSPDGRFVFVANFNLHGDPVPSTLSVVFAPDLSEVTRLPSCVMPHGSRTNLAGTRHYHVCMHSDQLVEVDLSSFSVSARYSVSPHGGGRLAVEDDGGGADHVTAGHAAAGHACAPTWVAPGRGDRAERYVYVACNGSDEVLEVDVVEWSVPRRFPVGPAPYNLEVTPDGERLVVTLKGGSRIAVLDLGAGVLLRELETSRPVPHGVVVSPDGRYAFVSNESVGGTPGTLDVFDLGALERVASVELRLQPTGLDLWRVDPVGAGPTVGTVP